MAPALNHPAGVSFIDDHGVTATNVEAAVYYGGGESYTRSRTYSHVCRFLSFVQIRLTVFARLVPYSWL
jgi:hypothetical protein